ncbi:MAG: DNA-binding protein [Clostridiaceae bacterium]|nr:DNA-binding protein [Clostridiaceae bacterium]
MDYISIAEATAKWGIARCQVQALCDECRIPRLTKFGKTWAIPKRAEKPARKSPLNECKSSGLIICLTSA